MSCAAVVVKGVALLGNSNGQLGELRQALLRKMKLGQRWEILEVVQLGEAPEHVAREPGGTNHHRPRKLGGRQVGKPGRVCVPSVLEWVGEPGGAGG